MHNKVDNTSDEFKIDSLELADWALEKIAIAENEINKNSTYAQSQRDKINDWEADVNKAHINTIEHFKTHLQAYLINEGVKSKRLINGNIGFRSRQPKWSFVDEDELVKELEKTELHDLVRVKKEPALSEMKKHLDIVNGKVIYSKTGEVLKNVTVEEQEPNFNVKTK